MQLSKTKYLAFIADKFYSVACTSNSLYPCFAILKVDNLRLWFTKKRGLRISASKNGGEYKK